MQKICICNMGILYVLRSSALYGPGFGSKPGLLQKFVGRAGAEKILNMLGLGRGLVF